MISHRLAPHRTSPIHDISARTRRWAIGAAAVALLSGVLAASYPAAPTDSGLAGCATLSAAHQIAAAGWPVIGAQFAGSRMPGLRLSGMAYVDIATKLVSRHAYGGETAWFYERLAAACAQHGQPLPFYP